MEKFGIKLKLGGNIFTSGETVFGHVFVVLKDSIKARSIKISVSGKAKTKWDYYNPATKVYISCQGEDSYINAEYLLWDGKFHDDSLKPGIHEFPFNFTIPDRCPPSFEGDHGKIRYFCKAIIDRPWHLDNKAELKFIVKPQFDLNHLPGLGRRVVGAIDEKLGAMFFKHGKIDAKITLPKNGYIIGETITPNITITNSSNRTIQKIDIALVQFVTYAAKHGGLFRCENGIGEPSRCHQTKKSHRNIVEHKTDLKILPNSTGNSPHTSITVPDVPTSFNTSPIIKIEYFLKVALVADGLVANSVSVELPLVIGTIPIDDGQSLASTSNTYPDPPPPYEEVRKMSIE